MPSATSRLRSVVGANGIVILDPGDQVLRAGIQVETIRTAPIVAGSPYA